MTAAQRRRASAPFALLPSGDGGVTVDSGHYRLVLSGDGLWARLYDRDGEEWAALSLLGAFDTVHERDETLEASRPEIVKEPGDDGTGRPLVVRTERRSSCWGRAATTLECHTGHLLLRAEVEGEGRLGSVRLLGGRSLLPRCLGPIYTGSTLPTLFSPNPEGPRSILRSAGKPSVVGVTGDSLPGRGHWFFTPAPLYLALSGTSGTGPEGPAAAGRGWLGLGLVEAVEEMDFTELAYVPADEGFHLELHYEGHRAVAGRFSAPAVLVVPGVGDPYAGIEQYRSHLVEAGKLEVRPPRSRPAWWSAPMFCGWGAQCYLAAQAGTTASEQCSQGNYDRFLSELDGEGLQPSTVVIDDGWQESYGLAVPHPVRWPGLRSWVDGRHRQGQRVLLWWKAWDVTGVPREWCITNRAGAAVAVDPRHPEMKRLTAQNMAQMLGKDGLAADGLKVDFTARTPTGWDLPDRGRWGIALLHEYLELLYTAAKESNPEALVVTQTPNPGFGDVSDMIRLNDMLRLDEANPQSPVVAQMRYRAAVARAACPGLLIDSDDWCAPDLGQWREYLSVKKEIGVPALYYTTHLDRTGEALSAQDYDTLRELWASTTAGGPVTEQRNERGQAQ